jgi:CNT family concentrative nucleoside transporter
MAISWLLSTDRRKVNIRTVVSGLILQGLFAALILKSNTGQWIFDHANVIAMKIVSFSDEGALFLFGEKFREHFFAFKVLPTIIFISSLSYVLFYYGIMQKIVSALAWIMQRAMGISGAESLACAANIFLGQTEAPLLIRPYLKTMTRSEIMCLMTGGMATVAGGVLAAYVGIGISAGHLLAASLMSAPAAIIVSKIMHPETEVPVTNASAELDFEQPAVNAFDAACRGAADGLTLSLNVAAMLIAFIGLVALVNYILSSFSGLFGGVLTLQDIMGYVFYPCALLIGVDASEAFKVATLLGEKTVLNEFIAYMKLSDLIEKQQISERAASLTTYALCGFSNFSSIAIQIGGIGRLEPSRSKDFSQLAFRSMIAGTLACLMTAAMASLFF